MGIMVKAIETGYYGTRRRAGDVFEIQSEEERGKWMGAIDAEVIKKGHRQPFTSEVKGTAAGGNIFSPPGGKPAWEEHKSEIKVEIKDPAPSPVKRHSRSKTKK